MVNGRAEGPHPSPRTSAFAGGCAGFVSSIVTCPLDVIKTRLQAQAHAHPAEAGDTRARSVAHLVQRIWHDDGIRGFYRGLAPTLIGYLPTWAIYFCVYDTCKRHLAPVLNRSGDREFGVHIMSALLAGSFSTLSTSPLWVVKTRFMLQTSKSPEHMRYRSTLEAFRLIYRTEGFRGFYRGLVPSLLGVSHVVVQFPLYEFFKRLSREHQHKEDLSPLTILLCSGGSKMLASITTYPHEVLRTRLQMIPHTSHRTYSGFIQAIVVIARDEGIQGFYKGMGINLIRTVPNSGLTILTYELIMRYVTLWSSHHGISL